MYDANNKDTPTMEKILFLEMESGDRGWNKGYRWMIQTPDQDEFFFQDRDRAEEFIVREGMLVISIPKMIELRKQRFPETYA